MDDTAKYLIHADVAADGIVERSDVVGAIFGQTEGLLGDDLDLRDLQQSSKVGRIDVTIESEGGRSYGEVTISSTLDRVQTAILAASLETIDRIGPCQSVVEVSSIEDVRGAKRRAIVDRAKELLATAFEEDIMTSDEIFEEVRESVRVERITDYAGLPAGPRVAKGDAIIVVEGRADVLTLLKYGVKNAVGVEGTSIPEAVADLTRELTTTVFLDGDRGGDLILREIAQVGDVDYVAFAPEDRSVEDLARHEVLSALRDKVPYDVARARFEATGDEAGPPEEATTVESPGDDAPDRDRSDAESHSPETTAATDGSARPAPDANELATGGPTDLDAEVGIAGEATPSEPDTEPASDPAQDPEPRETETSPAPDDDPEPDATDPDDAADPAQPRPPQTLNDHVAALVDSGTGTVRLLDGDFAIIDEVDADGAVEAVAAADTVPTTVVVDGPVTQRLLDVSAQRGVGQVVGTSRGDFTKQPTSVRIRLAEDVRSAGA